MNKFFSLIALFFALAVSFASCDKDDKSDSDITQRLNRENKEKGEKFLADNRNCAGVVETASGLQYKVDTLGTGVRPQLLDTVKITYTGSLVNGTVFTKTTSGMPVEEQIEGMREGLQLMPEGSSFDLYVPYYMAYGAQSQNVLYSGKIVSISAYSMLHFRVKIEKVRPYLY